MDDGEGVIRLADGDNEIYLHNGDNVDFDRLALRETGLILIV